MTDTTTKLRLELIRFGEIIDVRGKDDEYEKHMVAHSCGKDQFPAYWCEAHDTKLANIGQLMMHFEDCGQEAHRVVTFCRAHRWFEEVGAEQREGFRKAGFLG